MYSIIGKVCGWNKLTQKFGTNIEPSFSAINPGLLQPLP